MYVKKYEIMFFKKKGSIIRTHVSVPFVSLRQHCSLIISFFYYCHFFGYLSFFFQKKKVLNPQDSHVYVKSPRQKQGQPPQSQSRSNQVLYTFNNFFLSIK